MSHSSRRRCFSQRWPISWPLVCVLRFLSISQTQPVMQNREAQGILGYSYLVRSGDGIVNVRWICSQLSVPPSTIAEVCIRFLFCAPTNEWDFTSQEFCHGSRDVYELQLAPNCPHAEPRVIRSRPGMGISWQWRCNVGSCFDVSHYV